MEILSVQDLSKKYDKFTLKNVSFKLDKGFIMGFIGRNGAGKTTTLKSLLNLVRPDSGHIEVLGQDFAANEFSCKQKIGAMFGGIDYYPKKKLKDIAGIVRRFYNNWDDQAYIEYLERFGLDPEQHAENLSDGMKVKFALALALSHHAQLLILDEPTSGLDPVSRDDLLELFQELILDGEKSILFSTHITSDLEKCADYITYIKNGEIMTSSEKDEWLASFRLVRGTGDILTDALAKLLIGCKKNAFGFAALVKTATLDQAMAAAKGKSGQIEVATADLESIMIHLERE